jgi:uncharacterized protein YjbJ (UPF0337 family)
LIDACGVGQTLISFTGVSNELGSHRRQLKQFKGKIQQQWGKLTDDDLDLIEGKRTELVGRLQQKYGYARDQAEREIDDWLKSAH